MTRDQLTPSEKVLYDDNYQSTPKVHRDGCYICEDPDYRRMGLPLCRRCINCSTKDKFGHIAADDTVCDDCGFDEQEYWAQCQVQAQYWMERKGLK